MSEQTTRGNVDKPSKPAHKPPPELPLRPLLVCLLANGVIPLIRGDESLAKEARVLSDELLDADSDLTRGGFASRLEQLITFSAGIALFSPNENPEATISRTDEGMYAAKRAGKNRVFTVV